MRASGLPDDDPGYVSTQDAQLREADALEKDLRFKEAVPIYEKLVEAGSGRDPHWTAYVLFRMAGAQVESGDRAGAQESAGVAVTLDPEEPSYQIFQAELNAGLSGERSSAVVHARRDQGSARRLVSTNGVLHIFVRGKNTEPWDTEDVDKMRLQIEESDRWIQARAQESGVSARPVFTHRFLTLSDEPFWRRVDVPEAESSPEYRKAWLDAILVRFGADSYADLFDRTFEGMDLANRAVVFHTANRTIPFTLLSPCRTEPADLESVTVQSGTSEFSGLYAAVRYTHRLLHLYGADDLFDKAPDPAVPENEIMNFGAHRLDDCELCALTRYAVGWTDQPPHLSRLRLQGLAAAPKRKKGAHG